NYCATAGCHGPKAKSEFHLERVYLNERSDPRVVRRNLYATLEQVNRQTPGASKLLTAPVQSHGGKPNSVFHAHNIEHYRQLVDWVQRGGGQTVKPTTTPAAALADAPNPLLQRLPISPPLP